MNANNINKQIKFKGHSKYIYLLKDFFYLKSNVDKTFCEKNIKSVINLFYLTSSKGIKGHVRSLSTKKSTCL